ncbi:MAG: PrsW family intramembrane metalloprotease [Thermoplasmatota archaeon]
MAILTPDEWFVVGSVLLFVGAAFAPSLLYLAWIRNTERWRREPLRAVVRAFLWGAGAAVVISLVLEALLGARPESVRARGFSTPFYLAVVVAPLVEEFAKAVGLTRVKDFAPEPENGLIYGAAAGLGFAGTENLLYEGSALVTQGIAAYFATLLFRSVASALLHGGATALTGYGIWRIRTGHGTILGLVGLFALAVACHATFNYVIETNEGGSFLVALALAIGVFLFAVRRVRALDRQSAPPGVG